MHVITRAALQPDVLCLWFKVQVGTSLGSSKHPFWRSWRDAVSAAVGVQGRFCGARRGEGMWGHDWGGFSGSLAMLMVLLVYVGVVIYDVYAKVQIRGQGRQTRHRSPCLFRVASSIRRWLLPGDPWGPGVGFAPSW
jgi:hypothetical protein